MIRKKRNQTALLFAAAMLLLSVLLISLPVYQFDANVLTKRSGNTFVGDDRYKAARAEVDALMADYASRGIHTEVSEEVIERTNSKGATTSLIVFRVNKSVSASGWDFIRAGFPSAWLLIALLCAEGLALLLSLLGCAGTMDTEWKNLPTRASLPRKIAPLLAVLAMALAVLFVLHTAVVINRRIIPFAEGQAPSPGEAVLAAADQLIYQSAGGDSTAELLKNTASRCAAQWWLQLPVLLLFALALTRVAFGEIARLFRRALLYAFVVVLCAVTLYPFIIMFTSAFRTDAEATDVTFRYLFPHEWMWGNISHILSRGVLRYLVNSLLLAVGATVLTLLAGIPAAYAMARMRFRGRRLYMGFVIMSQMFSPVVLLVGISKLMLEIRLNDTLWGLVFVNAAFNQAFAVWLLRGTFVAISSEMEQAAAIDGCNTVSALIRVLLPMAAPGIVTTLIFVFINSWNEYTISTVIINSDINRPITVGLTQFAAFSMIQWNYLFASSLLATIPVVILFMLIEKHLVSGLTSGGVKG